MSERFELIAEQMAAGLQVQRVWSDLVYNVKDNQFDGGAKGDGTTDDTNAVQAAINAANAAGGGIVCFPPGTYLLGQISVNSNIVMRGTGKDITTLKLKNSVNNHFIVNSDQTNGNTNIIVEEMTIDGNKANQLAGSAYFCIHFSKASNVIIRNVKAINAISHGISVRSASYADIISCDADNNGGNGIVTSDQNYAVITDCWAYSNALVGIRMEGATDYSSVANNISYLNGQSGYSLPITATVLGVSVTGNVSYKNGFHGFEIQGQNIAVDGNISAYNGGTITTHQGILVNGDQVSVTSNQIFYNAGVGIDAGNCNQIVIDGNMVERNGIMGIEINTTKDAIVSNNNIVANAQTDHTYPGIMVWGNNQFVGDSLNTNIIGNRITNAGSGNQAYGIKITADTQNTIVQSNDVTDGGATSAMLIQTSSVVCSNNIGFNSDNVTGSFAVDSVGTKTIIIAHGLGYTPKSQNIVATMYTNGIEDFLAFAPMVDSVDSTNVVIKVFVQTASATAGAQAKMNVFIR